MPTRTISNTGGNWNSTGTWVEGVVPTNLDDVVATATSGNLTVTATAAALSVNFTNYVGTFTVNSGITLTVGGAFTMVAGMTIGASSTGTLSFTATATLTSGGKVWPGNMTLTAGAARTFTLSGAWEVTGAFNITPAGASFVATLNSSSMTVRGNVTLGSNNAVGVGLGGTTNLILGTSTSQTLTTNQTGSGFVSVTLPVTVNATGTLTISTPTAKLAFGTFTHTAGTVVTTGSTVRWSTSSTISANGITWNAVEFGTTTVTITLSQNFNVSGTLSFANNVNFQGANTINFSGTSISQSGLTNDLLYASPVAGACTVSITETCSISQGAQDFRLPITINAPGKTVTFSTSFRHNQGTFTLTSGSVSMSSALTWTTATNATTYNFNAAGFVFPNYVSSVSTTFGGSEGCTFTTFTSTTAGITYVFAINETYTVNSGITLTGTSASRISFVSSSANTKAIFTVLQGASMDVGYVNPTDIDSSLGQTVWSYRGTITRCDNWQQLPVQPKTVAHFNV